MVEGHGPQGDRSWLGAGGRRRSTDVSGLAAEGGSLTDRAGSRDRARAPIVNQSGSLPIQAFEGPTAASPGHSRVVLPGPRLSDMLKVCHTKPLPNCSCKPSDALFCFPIAKDWNRRQQWDPCFVLLKADGLEAAES